jgi:CubicO group peptidase (beta-lactamase class C family)
MNKRICTLALALLALLSTALRALAQGAGPQGPTDPQEVEAFADAFFAEKMTEYHIPGAAFVLVKDGQILFAKGYGYADLDNQTPVVPDKTVFCAGSVGKLFTSTAVMQLVERELIDLDDDVNQYLDLFRIEDTYPEPVTFAHLLTHTGGFDEREAGIWVEDTSEVMPLGAYLAAALPPRVRPPGQVTQYSNHGMALAGYLVEVISGIPYAEYIEQNIFNPLGMNRSTFRQPIPPDMAPDLALGYKYILGRYLPAPVKYSNVVPAGMVHVTATDMASFLIAHLQEGCYGEARILEEDTVREMHRQHFTNDPRLPGFAYGFMEHLQNDRRALWHTGSSTTHHSLLFLLPDDDVGLFMSANLLDRRISHDLMEAFVDHYFPALTESRAPQPLADSRDRASRFAGAYRVNKHAHLTLEKMSQLGRDVRVTADGDGMLTVHLPNQTTQWVEIEPLLFQRVGGGDYSAFEEDEEGRITHMFLADMPAVAYERLAWYETSPVHLGLLGFAALFFLSAILAGPVSCMIRRIRHKPSPQVKRPARLARWLAVLVIALYLMFFAARVLVGMQVTYDSPPILNALFALAVTAIVLTIALAVFAALAWKDRYWDTLGRLHYTLVTLAAVALALFLNYWNLL